MCESHNPDSDHIHPQPAACETHMAQTYTLEEAAGRLGITPEEMKRRLKEDWKTLRSFRDGPTLRFRATDIDELARSLGAASDPSLQLAPLSEAPPPGSDDFKVPELSIEARKDDGA